MREMYETHRLLEAWANVASNHRKSGESWSKQVFYHNQEAE